MNVGELISFSQYMDTCSQKHSISGALAFESDQLICLIEGKHQGISSVLEHEYFTPRNSKLRKLHEGTIEQRLFNSWHFALAEDISLSLTSILSDNEALLTLFMDIAGRLEKTPVYN